MTQQCDRRLGWIPDLPDIRDFKYSTPPKLDIPKSASVKRWCSPVEDQGRAGSCTGQAAVGNMEWLMNKNKRPFTDLSRLFPYYNARVMEGSVLSDAGAYIRDVVKGLKLFGTCSEAVWPYDVAKVTSAPSVKAYAEALSYQIETYERLSTIDEMKACIASGFPFIFGFAVYDGFMSAEVARTGTAKMPKKGEKMQGGHAVMAVAYSDRTKRFTVRNSWGEKWGRKGYFTLPYGFFETRDLSDDFWTIRSGEQL